MNVWLTLEQLTESCEAGENHSALLIQADIWRRCAVHYRLQSLTPLPPDELDDVIDEAEMLENLHIDTLHELAASVSADMTCIPSYRVPLFIVRRDDDDDKPTDHYEEIPY